LPPARRWPRARSSWSRSPECYAYPALVTRPRRSCRLRSPASGGRCVLAVASDRVPIASSAERGGCNSSQGRRSKWAPRDRRGSCMASRWRSHTAHSSCHRPSGMRRLAKRWRTCSCWLRRGSLPSWRSDRTARDLPRADPRPSLLLQTLSRFAQAQPPGAGASGLTPDQAQRWRCSLSPRQALSDHGGSWPPGRRCAGARTAPGNNQYPLRDVCSSGCQPCRGRGYLTTPDHTRPGASRQRCVQSQPASCVKLSSNPLTVVVLKY
jgi:hypothetical protein